MKFSIDRTVDNSGLEAGVSVAERYHGCHRNICDEVFTTAECVDVVRNLQPQRLEDPIRLDGAGGASKASAYILFGACFLSLKKTQAWTSVK